MNIRLRNATLLASCILFFAGCYQGGEDRCGENQTYSGSTQTCECVEGAIVEDGACALCGENTAIVDNTCVCALGYAADETGACVEVPSGLGFDCSADSDCTNPDYSHCQDDVDGTNYCSAQNCSADDDCAAGYACAVWETPSFCERPPTGMGDTCAAPEDCTGEANLCESQALNMCITTGCDVADNDCPVGYFCCDISAFGGSTICAPHSFAATCPG